MCGPIGQGGRKEGGRTEGNKAGGRKRGRGAGRKGEKRRSTHLSEEVVEVGEEHTQA
jgi:hypothetical protein